MMRRTTLASTLAITALLGASAGTVSTASAAVTDTRAYVNTFGTTTKPVHYQKFLWPTKPFGVPKQVRSTFGEPRSLVMNRHGLKGYAFHEYLYGLNQISSPGRRMIHDGIDIFAKKGTVVYSLENGRAKLGGIKPYAAWVKVGNFRYEHIKALVKPGQKVIAYKTPIGVVATPDHHLHLTRYFRGVPVNPLAYGGFVGYRDTVAPRLFDLSLYSPEGIRMDPNNLGGPVAIAVGASDPQSGAALGPLRSKGLIPAGQYNELSARGQSQYGGTGVYGLSYAIETHYGAPVMGPYEVLKANAIPPAYISDRIYTVASNRNDWVHHLWYRLSMRSPSGDGFVDMNALMPGGYRIKVTARDVAGNLTTEYFPITVAAR